jgi:hypothetical protein
VRFQVPTAVKMLMLVFWAETLESYILVQWFPNGVSRHPGVSRGTTRCVAKLKENIFKLRLLVIINN